MVEGPQPAHVVRPYDGFWRVLKLGLWTTIVLGWFLSWVVGDGNAGIVDVSPRPATISTSTLCSIAVFAAFWLAWSITRGLRYSFLLVMRGHGAGRGPFVAVGSIAVCILCWALWEFEGTLCTVVLLAGFVLSDGVVIAAGVWHLSGGRFLRATRGREPVASDACPTD